MPGSIKEVESVLELYWAWLRNRTGLRELDDWVEITTPYLDRHNDCLQIYVRSDKDGFVLADDGYVLNDLEQSGYAVTNARCRELIEATLKRFGVRRKGNVLEVEACVATFADRKHNLLRAMLAVEDAVGSSE